MDFNIYNVAEIVDQEAPDRDLCFFELFTHKYIRNRTECQQALQLKVGESMSAFTVEGVMVTIARIA